MTAIYKRELRSYFTTMTGYVFIGVLLLLTGIVCTLVNFTSALPNFEYALSTVSYIFLLIVPILTMSVIAEERKNRTDQLLYSLPQSSLDIVMGKFLAIVTVFALPVVLMCAVPLILSMYGTVPFLSAYAAILGFFVMGVALLAFGLFVSSMTESPVIAAVISFFSLLFMYLLNVFATLIPRTSTASFVAFVLLSAVIALIVYAVTKNTVVSAVLFIIAAAVLVLVMSFAPASLEGAFPDMLTWLCVYDRFEKFLSGIFDLGAIVYYLSVAGVCLFLTSQSLERRRYN